jgi:hypothetical protein
MTPDEQIKQLEQSLKETICFNHKCSDTHCLKSMVHIFVPRFPGKSCRNGDDCDQPNCWHAHPETWKPPVDKIIYELCDKTYCTNPMCCMIHPEIEPRVYHEHNNTFRKPCRSGKLCRNAASPDNPCRFDHVTKQTPCVHGVSCWFKDRCLYQHPIVSNEETHMNPEMCMLDVMDFHQPHRPMVRPEHLRFPSKYHPVGIYLPHPVAPNTKYT